MNNTMRWKWYKVFFDLKIEDFHNYIETMEDSIESQKSSLEERFNKESHHITDPEHKQELYEHMFMDEYESLNKHYPQILRKSLFISLYSFMESELKTIAENVEENTSTNIRLVDISYSGTQKYFFYIKNVNNIKIGIDQNTMKKFIKYNSLRNYFVHNDSASIKQKQYNDLKALPFVTFKKFAAVDPSINNENWYNVKCLTEDFNKHYLELISLFFDALFNALSELEDN
ncbi:hypothetical protein ACM26V_16890 [Salipaludibacillus sp. HK11]|uniref:hypothetical protein n=1 Tax=Salipaludibacillus sp. HK11 TaxID=3394320 RepID=UPI0039FD0CA0